MGTSSCEVAAGTSKIAEKTEPYTRHEHKYMNDDENKPANEDAPRGMSDELVDGDTLDITDDPSKKEQPLEPQDNPS